MKIIILFFSICMIFLSGCTSFSKHVNSINSTKLNENFVLKKNNEKNITGNLIFLNNRRTINSLFDWKQINDNYIIKFKGPLGFNGVTKIVGNKNKIKSYCLFKTCINPAKIFSTIIYNDIPFNYLSYWLFATYYPDIKIINLHYDKHGNLISFMQNGWKIKYSHFLIKNKKILFPNKIEISRENVKFIINISKYENI